RALFRCVETALLALRRHPSRGRGVQRRTRSVQGRQGHNSLSALAARPREVDRADRKVPRKRGRRSRKGQGGRVEEALAPPPSKGRSFFRKSCKLLQIV